MTPKSFRELEEGATKGPWAADQSEVWGKPEYIQVAHTNSLPGCGMNWDSEQNHANAELITRLRNAAPAILEALEKASVSYHNKGCQVSFTGDNCTCHVSAATKALAILNGEVEGCEAADHLRDITKKEPNQ